MSRRTAFLLAGLWVGWALLGFLALWLINGLELGGGEKEYYYVGGTKFEIVSVYGEEERVSSLAYAVALLLVVTVPAGLAFWKFGDRWWSGLFLLVGAVSLIAAGFYAAIAPIEIEYGRATDCPSIDAFMQGLCPTATPTPPPQ